MRKAFPVGVKEDEQDREGGDKGCQEEEEEGGQNDLNQLWEVLAAIRE